MAPLAAANIRTACHNPQAWAASVAAGAIQALAVLAAAWAVVAEAGGRPMAARTRKILHDDETRAKIQAAQIINRFQQCLEGTITLDAQQVSVGKALLNKVLPDLQSTTLKGDKDNPFMIVSKDQKDAAVKAATRAAS
jgi:hypothetical protein